MRRRKPSLQRPPLREQSGPRTVQAPPVPVTAARRGAVQRGRGFYPSPLSPHYRPVMKRERSVSTSEDSDEASASESRASHESMESADERGSGSDSEIDSSDDAPVENEPYSPPDSDNEVVPAPQPKPDAEKPANAPEEAPDKVQKSQMSSAVKEALLRKELRLTDGSFRKMKDLKPTEVRIHVDIRGRDNSVYYNYIYTNHLDSPDDTVYFRYKYVKRAPLSRYIHSCVAGRGLAALEEATSDEENVPEKKSKLEPSEGPSPDSKDDPPPEADTEPEQEQEPEVDPEPEPEVETESKAAVKESE